MDIKEPQVSSVLASVLERGQKYQAVQCIVNSAPQSLWDRHINNVVAFQERFDPFGILRDVPVDPDLAPEDRIDCTGKEVSDLLWQAVLDPTESEATRTLRSLAREAVGRQMKG